MSFLFIAVRDTFCSYHVMDLCTKELGPSISALYSRGVNLSNVRTLCVIAEERPRIQLTSSFSKLFSNLGLSARSVSTSFGCRVNVGICLQVWYISVHCTGNAHCPGNVQVMYIVQVMHIVLVYFHSSQAVT